LGSSSNATSEAAHGHSLGLLHHVLEELLGTLELHVLDRLGGLTGVLEGDTEVSTAGAGRLGGRNLGRSVSNLEIGIISSVCVLSPVFSKLADPSQKFVRQ
jgi:hypothetical protein